MAVKSPKATAPTVAAATFLPCPSAYEITSKIVGPGIASKTADAAAKANHCSKDIAFLLLEGQAIHGRRNGARDFRDITAA
ncbi:hypothetical protein [Paracoccus sp. (in: a-proteobacteria)]|uniref:hypothetical protein n=1 Tax=Paracoccus sp. TaxID=267 RepID=UPI0035AFE842